jgi:hypothetical protein
MATYLLIIGNREALGWILTSRRMAFPDASRPEVRLIRIGDRLLIYTTRGAFGNPKRDRGRVVGTATVKSQVARLERPIRFGEREYPVGCDLDIGLVLPLGAGVELGPLVPELDTFAEHRQAWPMLLRRPLLRLTERDSERIGNRLKKLNKGGRFDDVLDEYSKWYRTGLEAESDPPAP